MTVIAMTREMGTLGKDVARLAARRLGLTVVHHELVDIHDPRAAAGRASEVARFLERPPDADGPAEPVADQGFLTPAEVLALARRGGVLIRGWGATRLLRGLPCVLSVRVTAPMEKRVAEMMRRLGVPERIARREIDRNDAAHSRSILAIFAEDWRNPLHYDLVLNTGHLSVEACADILCDAVRSATLEPTPQAEAKLADRLLAARIAETLHGPGRFGRRAVHVDAVVDNGRVRLYGAVGDGGAAGEIERAIRDMPGVAAIQNEIARIGRYFEG